jgi:hypothetical protein
LFKVSLFEVSLFELSLGSLPGLARGLSTSEAAVEETGATSGAGCAAATGASCGFELGACCDVAFCLAMAPVTESSPCSITLTRE